MYISLHSSTPEHANPDNSMMGGATVALDVDGRVGRGGRSTWPLGRTPLGCRWTSTTGWWPRVSCVVDYCGGDGTASTTLVFAADGELLEQRDGDQSPL